MDGATDPRRRVIGVISPAAAADIFSATGSAVYEWAVPSDQLFWSANALDLLQVSDAAAIASGRAYAQLLDKGASVGRLETVVNSPEIDRGDGVPYALEYAITPRHGVTLRVEDTGRWFAASDGRPLRAQGSVRVVNDRHERQHRLIATSEIDAFTGLVARNRFLEVVEAALADAIKVRSSIGFMIAAVDGLAHINEAYGFHVADEAIAEVGRRIRGRMRGGDLLGRLSGNKFGLLIRNCRQEDIETASERILHAVRETVLTTSAGPIAASVTLGAVICPRHAHTLPALLACAQEALGGVKSRRNSAFQLYAPNLERERQRRDNVRMTDEIISALNDRRITLAFQPIMAASGATQATSYECLVRVRASDGLLLPAATVVPLAEKLGLIRLLDARVLELAMAELATHPDVRLSVNVSTATTMDRDWLTSLAAHLRATPGAAQRLMVEITETSAVADLDDTRRFVAKVQELGSSVAIDDFGAGYTSFRNLRKLGVDCVKIDGAFVENFDRSEDDRHFVKTLVDLAHHMKLRTVAEWVQNAEVAAQLRDMGCDYLQGAFTGAAVEDKPWEAARIAEARSA